MSAIRAASVACAALVAAGVAALAAAPPDQEHAHQTRERLGTVHFVTSCTAPAQTQFDRALALLHSFEFAPAIDGFTRAATTDPTCAIAYWGIGLARWGNPFAAMIRTSAQIQQGLEAVAQARRMEPKTARERAYIDAASQLFANADRADQSARLRAYERAMADLAAAYPDDREASIFWALSLAASAPPTDKTFTNQLKAAAILEKLYPAEPDHPGITHYIIHSYDVPALADRALEAAHRYAAIAPSAPHALHMPSHIFTRVGAWQESIDTNLQSAAAARRDDNLAEMLHATDYMAYAYLQTGQDQAVQALMKDLPAIAAVFDPTKISGAAPGSAGLFALAAIPARWALEHRDWKAAAALPPPAPTRYPYTEAMTHFARALGESHLARLDDAQASVGALDKISRDLERAGEAYWAEQVAIQHDVASAFLLLARGNREGAVAAMRAASMREDATEKSVITPGPLAPARELLADMLLDLKQPRAALPEYRATLQKEPNRFRAVYGAATAAAQTGDRETARTYYQQLLTICARADSPGRPEIAEARLAVRGRQPQRGNGVAGSAGPVSGHN